MNRIYNLIWSKTKERWIVVSEKVKGNGKVPSSPLKSIAVLAAMLASGGPAYALDSGALPTGGQVTSGSASVVTSGTQMTVNQSTQKMIANWQGFDIGSAASVRFNQPGVNSAALNRVVGNNPSQIFGSLTSNGKVFLVNPSGVLFAPGASVNVGALVASTLNIKDSDFLAEKYSFLKEGTAGSVVNQGSLTGGFVALLGNSVENSGTIVTTKGSTGLGAGEAITLGFDPNGLMAITVDKAAYQAQVSNSGVIEADGGTVVMTASAADALLATVVNNSGTVRAGSMVERNGEIVIEGNSVTNSGTLDVSGVKGGAITLAGDQITLASGSTLDASGATGGGTVLVGGGWQGSGALHQATTVTMERGAKIDVSATQSGNGGTAVLWSDVTNNGSVTRVNGEILAKGGSESGDGGKIETSGHTLNIGDSVRVSTLSTNGNSGNWLLDPADVTISSSSDANYANASGTYTPTSSSATSTVNVTTLQTALSTGNVIITTTNSGTAGSGNGDININTPVTWASGYLLTLNAWHNINFNANVSITGGGVLSLIYGQAEAYQTTHPYNYNLGLGTSVDLLGSGAQLYTKEGNNGTQMSYTTITDRTGLMGINNNVNANYALGANVDLTSTPFTPINGGYSGIFAGLGHTISNVVINTLNGVSGNPDVGLFSWVGYSTFRDFGLVGGSVSAAGSRYIGALTGSTGSLSIVSNVYSTLSVTGDTNGAGGLVGSFSGSMINSYATGSVMGGLTADQGTGGLVAYLGDGGTISKSYASGNVTGQNNSGYIGGLAGFSIGVISDSYATGNVIGSNVVGGINTAAVGGFVGMFSYTPPRNGTAPYAIKSCYASGNVTAGRDGWIGGFVGAVAGPTINLYWDNESTPGLAGYGSAWGAAAVTGLTHAQMNAESNFTGFDFNNTWFSTGTDSPKLQALAQLVRVSANSASMVYGAGVLPTLSYSVTGGGTGTFSTAPTETTAALITSPVLSGGYAITVSGGTFSDSNYFVKYIPGTLTVTPKALTVTGTAFSDKVYNGNTTATLTGGSLSGVLDGDTSNVTLTQGGTFASKDAANSIAVTAADTLTGTAAGNYSLTQPTGLTGKITAKPVTLTAPALTKIYDGGTSYTAIAGDLTTLSNLLGVSGDTVTGITLAYTDKNAGTSNKTVSFTGATVSVPTNYTFTYVGNSTSTITPKALTQSGLTVPASRAYDGTAAAVVSGAAALQSAEATGTGTTADGIPYTGDQVSLTGTSVGTYNSPNVGATTVSFSGLSLTGAQAGNYSLTMQSPASASITTNAITVTANNQSRTYGSANPTTGAVTLTGTLGSGDALGMATVTSAATSTTAAGSTPSLTPSSQAFTTGSAANYAITYSPGTLSITPRPLTLSASKTYNGTVDLSSVNLGNLAGTETLTYSGATASSKDFGANNYINAITLSAGTNGGVTSNYTLPELTAASANNAVTINKATLTVTGSKTYDGTSNMVGSLTLGGFVGSETVGYSVASASSAHVAATNKYVSAITLTNDTGSSGGLASNYQIPASYNASTNHIDITAATLTPTLASGTAKVYDGGTSTPLTPGYSGLVTGDTAATLTYTSRAYDHADVLTAANVTVSGLAISGITGGNTSAVTDYSLSTTSLMTAATITPKTVALAGIKTYDGNATTSGTTFTVTNKIGSDSVGFTGTATLASKDNGTRNITSMDTLASINANYTTAAGSGTITINKAALTVTNTTVADKTYNGNTTATLSAGTLVGVVSGEDVTLTQAGTFSSKNVGTGLSVTANDSLSGTAISNYTLTQPTGLTGEITRLNSVTWTGGATGNWLDSTKWDGGAVPDKSNVATVVIPSGTTVSFNNTLGGTAEAGPVFVDTISMSGTSPSVTLALSAGTLNVATSLNLSGLTMTGGSIGGAGSLTTTNSFSQTAGTITSTGALSFTQTSGTLTLGNISGFSSLGVASAGNITQTSSTAIGGNGSLTKSGTGTLTLSGANTYTGGTTISDGTLALGSSGAIGSSGTITFGGGTLQSSSSNTSDYSGRFSNAVSQSYKLDTNGQSVTLATALTSNGGTLTKSGNGTLTLTGTNTYSGATTISAGTLSIGSGSTTGSVVGDIVDNAGLVINRTDALSYNGTISGSGTLTKSGTGTLTLSGTNTYSGLTTISTGVLKLGAAGDGTNTPLGTTGSGTIVSASGASLDLNGFTLGTAEALTLNGTGVAGGGALTNSSATASTYSGLITLGSGSSIVASSGNIILSNIGTITGSGFGLTLDGTAAGSSLASIIGTGAGTVTKTGTGSWTLSGANTYTGLTTISAGVLRAANNTALGTTAGGVSVTSGAALELSGDITIGAETLTLSGTGTGAVTGALRSISGNNTYGGAITLGAPTRINSDSNTLTLSDTIGGNTQNVTFGGTGNIASSGIIGTTTGTLTKDGNGTLTLFGANTYSGGTTVSAGTLTLGNTTALGSGTLTDNSAVNVASGITTITAQGLAGTGTLSLSNLATTPVALTVGANNSSTAYSGVLSGLGSLTKAGSGTLTLSGPNTYTGATTVNQGTLAAGVLSVGGTSGAFGNNSAVSLANTSGVTLDITGYNTQIGSLTGGGINGGNVILGSATLTVGGDNTTPLSYAGVISGTGGGVTKIGNGTLTLSGINTYTGITTISAGTLSLATAAGTGSGNISLGGGTLAATDNVDLGSRTVTLSADSGLSEASGKTFSGGVFSAAGSTLTLTGPGNFSLTAATNNFGTVNASGGNVTLVDGTGGIDLGNITATGTLNVASTDGAITGSGVVAVTGVTTLTAPAADITLNTATNNFGTVNASGRNVTLVDGVGGIDLGTTTATGTLGVTSTAGAITDSGTATVALTASLSGGANAITLDTASNSFTGAVTLNNSGAHDVALTNNRATILGASSVGSGTLTISSNGAITETGGVTQATGAGAATFNAGANPITLTQANDFTGTVTLSNSGTNNAAVTDANALILAGGTFGGNLDVIASGAVTQNAALYVTGTTSVNAGTGSVTLNTTANDFGGALTVAGGTTAIKDANTLTAHLATGATDLTAVTTLKADGTTGNLTTHSAGLTFGDAATTVTGNLAATSTGTVDQTGKLVVTGTSNIAAGSNSVTLADVTNDFGGALTAVGGTTSIKDANSLTAHLTTGTTDLTAATTLKADGTTGNLTTSSAGLTFGDAATTIAGNLAANSTGAVEQSGSLTVTGTSSVSAIDRNITLTNDNNDFGGAITASGKDISLTDRNLITVAINASNLHVTTGVGGITGGVQQAGPIVVSDTAIFTASTAINQDALLTDANNDFGGLVTFDNANNGNWRNVSLKDANALNVSLSTTGVTALTAVGGLTVDGTSGNLTTNSAGLTFGAAPTTVGDLVATSSGPVTQSNTLTVTGTSNINAGSNSVTLSDPGNDFVRALTLTGGATTIKDKNDLTANLTTGVTVLTAVGGLTVDGTSGNLTTNSAGLTFGAAPTTVTGDLLATSSGPVTQSNTLTVTGTSNINAGSNSVTLSDPGNDFVGALTLTGGATTIKDKNDLTANLTTGVTVLTAVGGLTLDGTSGNLTTNSAGLTFGAAPTTVTGDLLATSSGPVTQSNTLTVTGTSNINAGSNSVTLSDPGNDFVGALTLTGGATTIKDKNDLTANLTTGVTVLTAVGGLTLDGTSGNLTTNSAGLTFGAAPTTVTGDLLATSSGPVTQTNTLTVTGTTVITAVGNDVTLTNPDNDFVGDVTVTGTNVSITDKNGLTATLTSTGESTLAAGGDLTVSGTSNDLTTTTTNGGGTTFGTTTLSGTLTTTSTGDVSQTGPLVVGVTTVITAVGNDVTLTNPDNDFVGDVTVTGTNVSITDKNGLTATLTSTGESTFAAGGDLEVTGTAKDLTTTTTNGGGTSFGPTTLTGTLTTTSTGDVSQTGPLTVGGTTVITAVGNDVTLTNPDNDFVGDVTVTGTNVSITDKNGLTATLTSTGESTLAAGGDLEVTGTSKDLTTTTTNGGGTSFGTTTLTGTLTTTSTGDVSQTGPLVVGGTTVITAVGNDVTLTNPDNDFVGDVTVTGINVSITDKNGLTATLTSTGESTLAAGGDLTVSGTSNDLTTTTTNGGGTTFGTTALTGNLTTTSTGAVTQTGPLTVAGTTSITADGKDISLTNPDNDFVGDVTVTGSNVSITDKNGLTASLTSTGGGTLTAGGNLEVTGTAKDLTTTTTNGGGTTFGTTALTGNLTTTSTGAVTQTGPLTVGGTTSITADGKDISLSNPGNDFVGGVTLAGDNMDIVALRHLTFDNLTTTGNMIATAGKDLVFTAGMVEGNLTATSTGGNITKTTVVKIGGTRTLSAIAGTLNGFFTELPRNIIPSASQTTSTSQASNTVATVSPMFSGTENAVVAGGTGGAGGAGATTATGRTAGTGGTAGAATDITLASKTDGGSTGIIVGKPLVITAVANSFFIYELPQSTFVANNPKATLSVEVRSVNGTAMPEWMSFDAARMVITGTPPKNAKGEYRVELVARDQFGGKASTVLVVRVG